MDLVLAGTERTGSAKPRTTICSTVTLLLTGRCAHTPSMQRAPEWRSRRGRCNRVRCPHLQNTSVCLRKAAVAQALPAGPAPQQNQAVHTSPTSHQFRLHCFSLEPAARSEEHTSELQSPMYL